MGCEQWSADGVVSLGTDDGGWRGRHRSVYSVVSVSASHENETSWHPNGQTHALNPPMPPRLQRKPASAPEHLADVPMLGNRHNAPLALAPAEALCLERPH